MRLSTGELLGTAYWTITLLILAFVGRNTEKDIGELLVYYIPGTKWLYHLVFIVGLGMVSVLMTQTIVIDRLEILLLLKLVVDVVSTCVINRPESLAFIIWADIGVLGYLYCRNARVGLDRVLDLYEVFALILSIQTILTGMALLRQGISFDQVRFKSLLRIPFAGSNLIADVISSALLCIFVRYNARRTNKLLFGMKLGLYLIAALFIRSRGSILVMLLVMDWTVLKWIGRIKSSARRLFCYAVFVAVNAGVLLFALNSIVVESYFSRYADASSDVTSGRIGIWRYAWEEFLKRPLFGRGIRFEAKGFTDFTGAHNIWLDTLMSSGIMGFSLHACAIGIIAGRFFKRMKRPGNMGRDVFACFIVVGFLYLDSLFEVSYYNYQNDVIFWSLCGFLFSHMNRAGTSLKSLMMA